MKINKLNESMEHSYMFQYSCNNSTFGYDFQRYAQELGARRMYDHTQKGGGMHFYTVPSEDVYNKLKEVAKKRFTVEMYPLRPFDKERYANAKIQEAMMYYPSDDYDRDNSDYHKMLAREEASHPYVGRKVRWKEGRRVLTVTGAYDWRNGDTLVRCGNISLKPGQYELIEENMTIAYDQKTIDNQIKVIEKNLEDYKKLVIEEPDDKEYWQEQIKKCQDEISDLESYKPLDEGIDGWDNRTGVIRRIAKYLYNNPDAEPPVGYINRRSPEYEQEASRYGDYVTTPFGNIDTDTLMKYAKDHNLLNESGSLCGEDSIEVDYLTEAKIFGAKGKKKLHEDAEQYWAVYATDKETGKEYCAGVYESQRWAYYWAGMDRGADAEYGYGNFDYRVEQVSEYTPEMDNSKSELNDLKLRNYDNRNMTESVKRLGAGGRKLTEAKKGFLCKYKGCSIHDMGDVFVATNSTGLNIGQSKTKAGLEGIIDDYVANESGTKSIKEATGSRGFYVTTYWPDEKWSPEEGGSMSYGWDANRSKFFRTEQEAQEYVDYILDGCEIISNYEGEYEYKDEDGGLMKIAIEPFHKRGKGHSPARSWVEAEFDVPAERPYFDRKGNRLARNPRLVAKEKRAAADLEKEFLAGIDSATTRKELIDFISDIKYSKLFVNNGEIIGDKWKSLKEASYGGYKYEYEVHCISPDGKDCLLGASRSIEGAAEIAMNQLDEIMDNPFETPERKSKFVNNLYIVKAGTEQDVTPVNVEEYQSNLLFRLGVDTDNLVEDAQYDVKMMDLERVPSILNWDVADQLQDCFRENKLWVDELHYNQVQDRIEFDINWGDWKHEHMRAKWLLQELFEKLGIVAKINSHTTEEDGSDTYSAHYNVYAIKE